MKKVYPLLFAVSILGLAGCDFKPPAVVVTPTPPPPTKWEYKMVSSNKPISENIFIGLGEERWELVAVSIDPDTTTRKLFFKRPKLETVAAVPPASSANANKQ